MWGGAVNRQPGYRARNLQRRGFLYNIVSKKKAFPEKKSQRNILVKKSKPMSLDMWGGAVNRQPGYRARNLQRRVWFIYGFVQKNRLSSRKNLKKKKKIENQTLGHEKKILIFFIRRWGCAYSMRAVNRQPGYRPGRLVEPFAFFVFTIAPEQKFNKKTNVEIQIHKFRAARKKEIRRIKTKTSTKNKKLKNN